ARTFTNEHQLRLRRAGTEYQLVTALVQTAASAIANVFENPGERVSFRGEAGERNIDDGFSRFLHRVLDRNRFRFDAFFGGRARDRVSAINVRDTEVPEVFQAAADLFGAQFVGGHGAAGV